MIVAAPANPAIEPPIRLGEFWPEIDPADLREQQRIDGTITAPRLRAAAVEAAITTIEALAAWKIEQVAAGYASLAAVPADTVDGKSILLHRFHRAAGCLTKALILERYRDFDTTGKGDRKADQQTDPIDDCRRDHLNALADITGRPRATIELI